MTIILLVLIGLCLGSFVNALVWRIYQHHLPQKKRVASKKDLSICRGRSMCPHCQHTLGVVDLVPVISWLLLRGKCRYCRKSISIQYPLVELVTAGLFVASYAFWPLSINDYQSTIIFGLWLTAIIALVALIIYDIRWMILPNRIVFPLIVLAAVYTILRALQSNEPTASVLNAFGGLLIAGGIFYVLFQLSGGRWIGGGDVKLGFALGLLLGAPASAFLMLLTASLLGLLWSVPMIVAKRSSLASKIPFGPFLILSTIIIKLFGQSIIDWYVTTVLYL